MPIKLIVGQVATGDDFFNRKNEINILWQRIISGCNIILSAPRRVGKTSLVFAIRDNPKPNFHVIYLIMESVNDENEFFKKIYKQVVSELKAAKRFASFLKNCTKESLSRIEKISLSEVSVQITATAINYYDEFVALIKSLDCSDEKILLIVDEFAQTIMNIRNDQGDSQAVHFLKNNRTLRQMPEIMTKVQFIFAGSIGLENIVGAMNASQTINDLNTMQIGPFASGDAIDLIRALAKRPGLVFGDEQIEYLLKKVEWLIPFYIQLIMQELDTMTIDIQGEKSVTNAMVDSAFTRIIEHRNCFESWHTRLRAAYKKDEYNFAKEILNRIAENGSLALEAMIDCAAKHSLEDSYKDIVNVLKHDGYINNSPDPRAYRFNSPILKAWWLSNVAN
jgi:AAA+ ATPase superfamily predicted ATPase